MIYLSHRLFHDWFLTHDDIQLRHPSGVAIYKCIPSFAAFHAGIPGTLEIPTPVRQQAASCDDDLAKFVEWKRDAGPAIESHVGRQRLSRWRRLMRGNVVTEWFRMVGAWLVRVRCWDGGYPFARVHILGDAE